MPCGGIFPTAENDPFRPTIKCPASACFHCHTFDPLPDHFALEWDAFIHGTCVEAFLKTDEGQIIIGHGHAVVVRRPDGTEVEMYKER